MSNSTSLDFGQVLKLAFDDPSNSIQVKGVGGSLVTVPFDFIGVVYFSPTQEIYTYKTGGSAGTTVATLTVNYTDNTKSNLLNVTRT